MMRAELTFPFSNQEIQALLLDEEIELKGDRAEITKVKGGVRIDAQDITALRAAVNSVLKVLQTHEKAMAVQK
ncbi:MAG: KEOPS complex subunit Pcc1 [Candidatus Woesearchaeota archaeon]